MQGAKRVRHAADNLTPEEVRSSLERALGAAQRFSAQNRSAHGSWNGSRALLVLAGKVLQLNDLQWEPGPEVTPLHGFWYDPVTGLHFRLHSYGEFP